MAQAKYLRGEKRKLVDGREVTVIEKSGDSWRVLNQRGMVELIPQAKFKAFNAQAAD